MRGPRHFYRHSSAEMLEALFAAVIGMPAPAHAPFRTPKHQVEWAVGMERDLTPGARHILCAVMADVGALASDLGIDCLHATLKARRPELLAKFAQLKSDYDRGSWVWLHYRDIFKEARARWFFDRRKPSGTWTSGYLIPRGTAFVFDEFDIKGALMPIVDKYDAGAPGIAIEIHAIDGDGPRQEPQTLLSIFYEGRWNSRSVLKHGEPSAVCERVMHHIAVRIDGETGSMYVVGDISSKRVRGEIARAVAKVGLGLVGELAQLPPIRYNLQRLLNPMSFAWSSEHGIEFVCVSSLTLVGSCFGETGLDTTHQLGGEVEDVRARAIAKIRPRDQRLVRVVKGELRIVFVAKPGRSRGRVVSLGFNGPESCTMNLDCKEEDLLRARYFERWQLLAPLGASKGRGA